MREDGKENRRQKWLSGQLISNVCHPTIQTYFRCTACQYSLLFPDLCICSSCSAIQLCANVSFFFFFFNPSWFGTSHHQDWVNASYWHLGLTCSFSRLYSLLDWTLWKCHIFFLAISLASITMSDSINLYWMSKVMKQGIKFQSFQFKSPCCVH